MPGDPKKSRFKSFFTKKKKDYNLSYTKREQPILDALVKLPEGSDLRTGLRARLDAAKAKAAKQESPRKDMVQLLKDAQKAVASVEAVAPEMVLSSPVATDESIDKMDVGAAEKLVMKHRSAIANAYIPARTELAVLKTAVKQQDLSIESVSLDLERKLDLSERGDFDYASKALMAVARDIDTRHEAGEFDWPSHKKVTDALIADIDAHMVVVRKNADDLKGEITDTKGDPATLKSLAETAVQAEQYAKDKIAFDKALAEVDALVRVLEDWDHPSAGTYRDGVAIQSSTPPSDYALETGVLQTTKSELEFQIDAAKAAYKEKALAVATKAKAVRALLDGLVISSALDGSAGDYVESLRNQCWDEFEAIKLMIGTGANDGALDAASTMLDALEKRVKGFDDNFFAVANVAYYEWQCAQALSNKTYAKMCPDLQKTLQAKLDALIPAAGKMEPTAAIAKFEALRTEIAGSQVESYVSKAKARLEWLKDFSAKAKAADGELAKMLKAMASLMPDKNNKDFFKAYQGPLAKDLAEARALAGKESQASMDAAAEKLALVRDKTAEAIAAMSKQPTARSDDENELCMDIVAGQSAAVLEARKRVEDMAIFKAKYKELRPRVDAAELYVEMKPSLAGEMNAIKQLLKNAKELMENTHNLAQAEAILTSVESRRAKLVKDARRPPTELAKLGKEWRSAIRLMLTGFKGLQKNALDAVAPAEDDELTAAAGTVEARMVTAADYLTKEDFAEEEAFYSKADNKPADLRRQREKTLNKVKLLRDYVSNDPVLRSAQANPFGVKSVIGPVFMALREIEHKVMVSG